MSRLIDADEFMARCYQELKECEGEDFKEGIRWMMVDVVELPTIDAVPVVRCKDCKHRKNGGLHRSEKDGWTVVYDVPCNLGDDGFCSRGEKVTE